jgi:hypothetical protein
MLVFCAGCASGGGGASTGTASTTAPSRVREDPNIITREQIQEMRFTTAFDVVKTLRGNWLNARGVESFRYPTVVQVYLDEVRVGDVSTLQTIATAPIQYIRYYNAQDATAKWGVDHGRGAIYISTKVGRQGSVTPPGA